MKQIFKYLKYVLLGILTLTFVACKDKDPVRKYPENIGEYYFHKDVGNTQITINRDEFKIPVYRNNTEGSASVNIDAEGAKVVNNPVTFKDGSDRADIVFEHNIKEGTNAKLTLEINDNAYMYGCVETILNVYCDYKWDKENVYLGMFDPYKLLGAPNLDKIPVHYVTDNKGAYKILDMFNIPIKTKDGFVPLSKDIIEITPGEKEKTWQIKPQHAFNLGIDIYLIGHGYTEDYRGEINLEIDYCVQIHDNEGNIQWQSINEIAGMETPEKITFFPLNLKEEDIDI